MSFIFVFSSDVVSRRTITRETCVRFQASPYWICGEQSGTGTGSRLSVLVLALQTFC